MREKELMTSVNWKTCYPISRWNHLKKIYFYPLLSIILCVVTNPETTVMKIMACALSFLSYSFFFITTLHSVILIAFFEIKMLMQAVCLGNAELNQQPCPLTKISVVCNKFHCLVTEKK